MAKKMTWDIPGQMDLFTLLEEIKKEEAKAPVVFASRKEEILSAADEYLQKGERLTSLARERYERMVKKLSFSEVEKKLYQLNAKSYKHYHLIPKIAAVVIRPLLKGLTACDDTDDNMKMLRQLTGADITIEQVDSVEFAGSSASAIRAASRKLKVYQAEGLLKLTVKEEGYPPLEVYGARNMAHTKSNKSILWKDHTTTGDLAEILAWLTVINIYNEAVVNKDLIPAIDLKLASKYPSNESVLKQALTLPGFQSWTSEINDIHELYEQYPAPLSMPLQKFRWASKEAVDELCRILGYDKKVREDLVEDYDKVSVINRRLLREGKTPYVYQLTNMLDLAFKYIDPVNWGKVQGGKLKYHDFLSFHISDETRAKHDAGITPQYWPLPKNVGSIALHVLSNLDDVCQVVFEDYRERVVRLKYLDETKSRAKAWQTKKNIPEKTQKAARESVLNDYFGFVEFDEETDLKKADEFTKEFVAFKETYLKSLDTGNVSIRFRKLGNYKADGLYFYHIGCLCVDFRHPDSLVHEYGHCMDHTLGDDRPLSDAPDFYPVFSAYRSAFRRDLSKSGKSLKGKYNEDYYLQKSEVFARCMEMYVTRTLGMKNSICIPDDEVSFAYPQDEDMMIKVDAYYSELFKGLNEEKDENRAAA